MRNFLQQKYMLRLLITLTLALLIFNVAMPKIEEYNQKVYEEQQRLNSEANGYNQQGISFVFYDFGPSRSMQTTFFLSMIFLSLVLTKRIILSFLSILLFIPQFISTEYFILRLSKWMFYYSYIESDYFALLLISGELALSFWLASFICRRVRSELHGGTIK